jgi:hypothetical protein
VSYLSSSVALGGEDRENKRTHADREEYCESSDRYNPRRMAKRINKRLPKKMSRISTWYKTSAEGCTLKHFYRFSFQKGRIPEEKIRAEKAEKMKRAACSTESTRKMLFDGISVSYTYIGSNGQRITTIKVSSLDCQDGY